MNAVQMIRDCAIGQQHADAITVPDHGGGSRGNEVPEAGHILARVQDEGIVTDYRPIVELSV